MHIVINVAHKVDQAFLLRTFEGIIDRIEVRDQNTTKVLQQCGASQNRIGQTHFSLLAERDCLFGCFITNGKDIRRIKKFLKVCDFLECYLMIAEHFDLGDLRDGKWFRLRPDSQPLVFRIRGLNDDIAVEQPHSSRPGNGRS